MKSAKKSDKPRPEVTMHALPRSAIEAAERALFAAVLDDSKPDAMLVSIKVPSSKLPYTMRLLLSVGEGALDEQTGKSMMEAVQAALRPYTNGTPTD